MSKLIGKGVGILRDPAKRAEFIFGQPMNPCPRCGGYKMIYQTPIDSEMKLKGPVWIMCEECFHDGPKLDCAGMTREQVGRDPLVAKEVKRLWNEQPTTGKGAS